MKEAPLLRVSLLLLRADDGLLRFHTWGNSGLCHKQEPGISSPRTDEAST